MSKKILSIIFSLLIISVLAFAVTWGVINFNQVKTGMASTGVYTNEDVNKAYEDGYNNALKDKTDYEDLINGYRDNIISLNDTISQLSLQVNNLSNNNHDYHNQITSLNEQKTVLEEQVKILSDDKETNEKTIQSLNTVVYNLNKQISDMSLLSQNYSSQINALNSRISDLQSSVAYYENYIASLESTEKAVITFEYDGSVYGIQVVNKGSKLAINDPENTATIIFNGWKVNGEFINKDTYVVTENTRIIADVTYKQIVKFYNDTELYSEQIVNYNQPVSLPQSPSKDSYEFLGWSENGVDVIEDIEDLPVIENKTYYAVFVKIHTVTLMYENEVVSTQQVKNGSYASPVTLSPLHIMWKVDNSEIDFNNYQIFADTTITAVQYQIEFRSIKWNNDVRMSGAGTWTDGIDIYYSNGSTQYVFNKSSQSWAMMTWNGCNNIFGNRVWSDGKSIYFSNVNEQYVLDVGSHTWTKMTWKGIENYTAFQGLNIWTDGSKYYLSYNSYNYVLDTSSHTWSKITWKGLSRLEARNVWNYNGNTYYVSGSNQYILNKSTNTWTSITWEGCSGFYGNKLWSNGDTYICTGIDDKYYILKGTKWYEINISGVAYVDGANVWTDGKNFYYSANNLQYKILDYTR